LAGGWVLFLQWALLPRRARAQNISFNEKLFSPQQFFGSNKKGWNCPGSTLVMAWRAVVMVGSRLRERRSANPDEVEEEMRFYLEQMVEWARDLQDLCDVLAKPLKGKTGATRAPVPARHADSDKQ
jgi:hypothetical protein